MATKANRFGVVQTRMRRGQVELAVWRDAGSGKFHKAPPAAVAWMKAKAAAARANLMEDRTGRRLLTMEQAATRWYMIRGPKRWVPRGKPGWYHGWYYETRHWTPVVPPERAWQLPGASEARFTRQTYRHAPGGTPISSVVPEDVRTAAHTPAVELRGKRSIGRGRDADVPVRSERYQARRARAGLGERSGTGEVRRAKGVKVTKVTRRGAK